MLVTVDISSCLRCRHIDHSGAFTVRGARQICGHSDACQERVTKEEFLAEYPEYSSRDKLSDFKYHWIHRVLTRTSDDKVKGIVTWCPLKHGSKY